MTTKDLLKIINVLRMHSRDLSSATNTGAIIVGHGYTDEKPGKVIAKEYVEELANNLETISDALSDLIPEREVRVEEEDAS